MGSAECYRDGAGSTQGEGMESDSGLLAESRTGLLMLAVTGAVMACTFWVLISIALDPAPGMVHNFRDATYGGPLTWPARWMHLRSLEPGELTWIYVFLMLMLSASYIFALYLVRRDPRRSITAVLGGFFVLFALIFVFAPPFQSGDVYSYAFYGRSMTVYHANPYLLLPVARRADIFYPLVDWKLSASVYGPAFNFLSYAITRVAGNSVASNVLGFKMLAMFFYAGCLPLVFSLGRRVSPGSENFALAVSAWCPLLVMHICGGGHNESVMVFLVLAGFLLYRRDHAFWGLVMVLLAAMVKITAGLALAPYLVLYLRDKRGVPLRRLASAAAAVVIVPVMLYLPFWDGPRIFRTTRDMAKVFSFSSVPGLIAYESERLLVHLGVGSNRAGTLVSPVVRGGFLALSAVLVLYLLTRVKNFRSMVLVTAAVSLVWFFTSLYVLPWYLALGLMAAGIGGWNALSGTSIAVATIFTLYRVPDLYVSTVPWFQGKLGTNLYISLPFLLLFLALLAFGGYSAWRARSKAGTEALAFPGGLR